MKTCTGCKQKKPLSEFYKDRSKSDGYCSRCCTCKGYLWTKYRSRRIAKKNTSNAVDKWLYNDAARRLMATSGTPKHRFE